MKYIRTGKSAARIGGVCSRGLRSEAVIPHN